MNIVRGDVEERSSNDACARKASNAFLNVECK